MGFQFFPHDNTPTCVSTACFKQTCIIIIFFFSCVVQDKLVRLVIKDPGETREPQACRERTVRQDTLGSQVQWEVQGCPHGRGSCGDVLPVTFRGC